MSGGLVGLLDDIAALAKLAAASVDDVPSEELEQLENITIRSDGAPSQDRPDQS